MTGTTIMRKLFLAILISFVLCSINISPVAAAGLDADTNLLLHLNGTDGSTTMPDSSITNNKGNATVTLNAELDTTYKKFGTAALLLDNTNSYISYADSSDWDVFANTVDDWTIDLWVRHAQLPSNEDWYFYHEEDSSNNWRFRRAGGVAGATNFRLKVGNVYTLSLSGAGITDTDWHHVCLVKKGNEYGLYLDGVQGGYVQSNEVGNFTGSLYIGKPDTTNYFDGSIDEPRIQHSNYFNAAPNVGLTDTITVPIAEYSADTPTSMSQLIITTLFDY